MAWADTVNEAVARSFVGKVFRLEGSGHPKERQGAKFFTEFRAGLATYVVAMLSRDAMC